MNKITIKFATEDYEKIKRMAQKKELTISQYVRNLANIGLVFEEKGTPENSQNDGKVDINMLWRNILGCSIESRYLIRDLIKHMPNLSVDSCENIMHSANKKAATLIKELLNKFG